MNMETQNVLFLQRSSAKDIELVLISRKIFNIASEPDAEKLLWKIICIVHFFSMSLRINKLVCCVQQQVYHWIAYRIKSLL